MGEYRVTDDGLNLPTRTSDPESLEEGLIWHRSDKETIDFFVGGVIRSIPETTESVISSIQLQLLTAQLIEQKSISILLQKLIDEQKLTNKQITKILS